MKPATLMWPKAVAYPAKAVRMVIGARAVLDAAKGSTDGLSRWAVQLQQRRGSRTAVVAIAAKNARWAGRR